MTNVTYEQALEAYQILGKMCITYGFTPRHATGHFLHNREKPLTLKQVAESVLQTSLPDIELSDAIELAKTTPFSAEDWYYGCRGK